MKMRTNFTPEQQTIYDKFIRARNLAGIVPEASTAKTDYMPHSEVLATVDVVGLNHPLFVPNDAYVAFLEAYSEWLAVEPEFRKSERMSAINGDYGDADDWSDPGEKAYKEIF